MLEEGHREDHPKAGCPLGKPVVLLLIVRDARDVKMHPIHLFGHELLEERAGGDGASPSTSGVLEVPQSLLR